MTISELSKIVLAYATNRTEPFTSYQAYTDIEESQDKNLVSDTLGFMYRKGMLARQKTSEGRFLYALPDKAPSGYETIQPDKTEKPAAAIKPEEPEIKPKVRAMKEVQAVPAEVKTETMAETKVETKDSALPNVFLITLKAPGGIEITISSGSSQ